MSTATERRRMRLRNRLYGSVSAAEDQHPQHPHIISEPEVNNGPLEYQGEPANIDFDIHHETYEPSRASNLISYALFTLIPSGAVFFLLSLVQPKFVVNDDDGSVNYNKVLMISAIAGLVGLIIKYFLFKRV